MRSAPVAAALAIAAAAAVAVAAMSGCRSDRAAANAWCVPADTAAFLDGNRPRYTAALARARSWLDSFDIDPVALRRDGIKGKKKLTEQLDAYIRLYRVATGDDRTAILERIRRVVALTYGAAYHDFATVDERELKEDATSYLRTAVLMERLGLDTARYRAEIAKIQPRLDAQMASRGPNQQLAFHRYYRHFGLTEPFPLATALERGLIARRAPAAKLAVREVYDLTHEVFVPFDFGEQLDADAFTAEDRAYLRPALASLVETYAAAATPDVDLVAELLACQRYLRFVDDPTYRRGLELVLASQHADGSWGDLARAQQHFGARAREAIVLHTTLVALVALTAAFHEPWNPRCGA